MAPGSEPASGSDCAKAVVFSPRKTGKRYFSFCAGLSVNSTGFTSGPNTPGPRGGSAMVRTQRRTIHRMHLDRDELAIDEGPDRMLEQLEFLGKLEVHGGDPGHARIDVAPCRNGARTRRTARPRSRAASASASRARSSRP